MIKMLEEYHKKRDFARTTEPAGSSGSEPSQNKMTRLRFVVQKHDATRLHYDFRLESEDGVLKSWAVPKGISLDPKVKRLAVLTEDHPLDYLLFEGVIPAGNYGAGTVIVWDTGTFTSEQELVHQFNNGRITFTLFGHKLKGRFSIIKIKKYVPAKSSIVKTSRENQWLLIKANDQFASSEDLTVTKPESVLTRRAVSTRQNETGDRRQTETMTITNKGHTKDDDVSDEKKNATSIPQFSINVKPMLATAVDEPFDDKRWVFEIKWDGVRSIFFWHKTKGIFKMQSRSGKDITHRYPELIRPLKSAIRCKESIILDGEIVVLDKDGTPSFQDHQRRLNVDDDREIEFLSQQTPANYYLFDILYMDGKNLQGLEFLQRRKIQSDVIDKNSRIQISDFIGEVGKEVFDNVRKMNLEGMVAKYKSSKYLQGVRSREWLKIKTMKTQDCVVIGYTRGEGNREGYFGSLLLAVNNNNAVQLRFVGHTGSGFNFDQLGQIYNKLKEMKIGERSIDHIPYVNRDPIWIKPDLVAEVKFSSWTSDKIMRSPIFLRFREDKSPAECIIEEEKMAGEIVQQQHPVGGEQQRSADASSSLPRPPPPPRQTTTANTTSSLKASTPYFSNLDKIFWNKSQNHPQLTKKDLIDYYDRISKYILPHLKDRPLSLSRYPDGVKGKHFYHKNWDQEKPDFVESIKIYSKSKGGVINYVMCNNKDTLLWLANLGCIEMHPWYSHVNDFNICKDTVLEDEEKCALDSPDFMVFDLDPYIYSGNENKGEEPEYNVKAFKATMQIAYALEDLFDTLNIKSCVKTSGKTGLHIFVPIGLSYTYEQTRSFAQVIGKILIKRHAQKITTAWSTVERTGKVFFDHKQNAMGKTIASVFSARPTVSATVSMPVKWEDLSNILPTDFTILNTPDMLKKSGDQWNKILQNKQDIRKILEDVAQVKL
jgi:bifunctional non-homologous end joining protein LigD